jgi:hypothetical protein
MKYVKMLGLAAVVAMTFIAFAASTASATVLCTDTGCTAMYEPGTGIEATSSDIQVTSSFGTMTCTASEIAGAALNTGEAEKTVNVSVGFLDFNKCNGSFTELAYGSLELHTITAHKATLISKGIKVTTSLLGIHCVWGTGTGTTFGTVAGGETPTLILTATFEKLEGSAFCGSTNVWEGTYTIHQPHALYFG